MLKQNGEYLFYRVEELKTNDSSVSEIWKLVEANTVANVPLGLRNSRLDGATQPFADFSSAGACWLATGEYGAFDRDVGIRYLSLLMQYNPETTFRLIEVRITQKSAVVMLGKTNCASECSYSIIGQFPILTAPK